MEFRKYLSLILSFQFAIGLPLLQSAHAQNLPAGDDPVARVEQEVSSEFNAALAKGGLTEPTPQSPATRTKSLHLHPDQFHRIYDEQGRITAEISLARIDILNPEVALADISKELRFAYFPQRKEVEIQKVVFDAKLGRERITDSHVFKNIELTSNILVDPALGFYATKDGVHSFLIKHLKTSFCKKILVTPVVLPADPTAAITRIEILTQEVKPLPFEADRLFDGDLLLTFSDKRVERINRAEPVMNLGTNLLGMLALVQGANPDMDAMELYQKIFKENAADLAAFLEQQRALVDGAENDLVTHALRAWGQKLDYNELGLLFEKNSSGQNQFQALAVAPRNTFSADASPQGPWALNYLLIEKGKAADIAAGKAPRAWRQILIDHYAGKDVNSEQVKASAAAELNLRKRIFNRISTTFSRVVTKKRIAYTAVALAAVGANQALGGAPGEWLFDNMVRALNWSAEVPLLGNLTGPIAKSISFFTDASQRWGITRLLIGTGAILALNPLSYAIAKFAAVRNGKDWNPVRAFFTYGTRAYAYINYPIQKLLVWDRLRQKGLYEAVVNNKVDPLKNRAVFNSPFASKEELAKKAERVNTSLETDAARKGRAILLAAAIVSDSQSRQGNPIDVASLLMAGEGKSIESFAGLVGSASENARWTDLTAQVYRALVQMGDEGGNVAPEMLKEYIALYQGLALKFKNESSKSTSYVVRTLFRRSVNLMSKNVLGFVAFGKQWYDVYQRYSKVELSENTLDMAKHGYNEDYLMSGGIYALADPKKFADIPIAGIGAPEIITNQLSQVFVYGVQGAIDPPDPKEGLNNPYTPITNDSYSELRNREQTVTEGMGSIARGAANPEGGSFFGQHASVMVKLFEGFQVRFAADFITRSVGLFVTMYLLGENPNALEVAFRSVQLSTFFLVAKISFQFGAGGFIPGYATIWPYLQMSMSHMQSVTAANRQKIQLADYLLTTGREVRDVKMVQEGAALMKSLYADDKRKIPGKFNIAADQYTLELGSELQQYSLQPGNTPLPTQKSESLFKLINRSGAVISTVLFAGVSAVAMDPSSNAGELLVKALAWFGITYGGMKVAQKIVPPTVKMMKEKVITPIGAGIQSICNQIYGKGLRQ